MDDDLKDELLSQKQSSPVDTIISEYPLTHADFEKRLLNLQAMGAELAGTVREMAAVYYKDSETQWRAIHNTQVSLTIYAGITILLLFFIVLISLRIL